jgi:hypothetical protein
MNTASHSSAPAAPVNSAAPLDSAGLVNSAAPADRPTVARTEPVRAARLDDRAVAALAFGAAGLFMFNIVFGPFAIVLGAASARRHRSAGRQRTAAVIGVVLGVADLLVLAVLVASKIHGGNFAWHLG